MEGRRRVTEAREDEGCLGDGEGRTDMHEVHQLFVGLHNLYGTEVDATKHDAVILGGFDVGMQGGLAIQFDGQIDDIATLHETVRRGVGPASGDVDTNG